MTKNNTLHFRNQIQFEVFAECNTSVIVKIDNIEYFNRDYKANELHTENLDFYHDYNDGDRSYLEFFFTGEREVAKKYLKVNILGFLNFLKIFKKNSKKIFYASSSSVYGENTNFPLQEKELLNPKNVYGITKKLNEVIAEDYYKKYDIKVVGLRFFTVYGEWGRPDMFFLKLFKSLKKKKQCM